jgi:hypothetical protein
MKMGFSIFVNGANDEISENDYLILNANCVPEICTIST